jgi:hypothetical protein
MQYEKIIINWINSNLGNNITFSNFCNFCKSYKESPSHNLQELRSKNTKMLGDLFESFCKLYMEKVMLCDAVWYHNNVPKDIKKNLMLTNRDMGIDLIGSKDGNIYAVQCKYRTRKNKRIGVTWKDLSTFYAITARTGPFDKIIVMTNADYIKKIGIKDTRESVYAFNFFNSMKFGDWISMCQYQEWEPRRLGNSMNQIENSVHQSKIESKKKTEKTNKKHVLPSPEFIRQQRLKNMGLLPIKPVEIKKDISDIELDLILN